MGRAKPTKELLCADTLRATGAEATARFWARMRGAEAMATGAALRSIVFSGVEAMTRHSARLRVASLRGYDGVWSRVGRASADGCRGAALDCEGG